MQIIVRFIVDKNLLSESIVGKTFKIYHHSRFQETYAQKIIISVCSKNH